jgi:hypothetical protein
MKRKGILVKIKRLCVVLPIIRFGVTLVMIGAVLMTCKWYIDDEDMPDPLLPAPVVSSVSVSPKTETVVKGGFLEFTATVVVSGGADEAVEWSIVENHKTGTTISPLGGGGESKTLNCCG